MRHAHPSERLEKILRAQGSDPALWPPRSIEGGRATWIERTEDRFVLLVRVHVEFELVPCRSCGKPVTTRKHIEFVRSKVAAGPEVLETCSDCLREYYGGKVAAEGHM